MTARVDLTEFLTAYLAEVDEQIAVANARALAVEESLGKKEDNPRAVRDLFRALHTIKGLSAMVGVEPIVAIAHRMEEVLRGADRAGGSLPNAALEPVIEGVRAIEVRVRALRDKRPVAPPPALLLEALDAIEAGEAHGGRPRTPTLDLDPAISGKLAAFEKQQLLKALGEGKRAVRLEFVPSAERAAAGHSISTVRERLGAIAEIVKVIPVALTPSLLVPAGLSFVLLLVTDKSDADLAAIAGIDPSPEAVTRAIASIRKVPPVQPAEEPAALTTVAAEPFPDLPEEEPQRRSLLRVDVARVDDAMDQLSSLIVSRSRLARAVSLLDATTPEARELKQIAIDIARQLRGLRGALLHVRMVRVSEILERVPLVVRALRRTTGKRVRLELDAGDAELDKAVAERIFPAILHLVRNAVDHGIESPAERRAAGKPEEGLVRITTSSQSNAQLELRISDDGRGVDKALVAARAVEPVPTSESGLLELLCRPGLSTRAEVTTTSGRGMGMDIVKRVVVDQLHGDLTLSTQVGSGSCFSLRVPLTIAIIDVFVVLCGAARFVVPVSMVEEIVEIDGSRVLRAPVARAGGGAEKLGIFERRGEAVPLLDLASALGIVREGVASRAVVVRRQGQPAAFVLDKVTGQQEAVIRPINDALVNVTGVSGTTDLGDGKPTLVLDLLALATSAPTRLLGGPPRAPALPSGGGGHERERALP